MTTDTTADPTPILTTIGDLDSPYWGDERDRTIHLEGMAVAQQVQLIASLTIAAAMLWTLGPAGLGWAIALILSSAAGNLCYFRYIAARGVRFPSIVEAGRRKRGVLVVVLWVVLTAGLVRAMVLGMASLSIDDSVSTGLGFIVGVAASIAIVLAGARLLRRRRRAADVPDDVFADR